MPKAKIHYETSIINHVHAELRMHRKVFIVVDFTKIQDAVNVACAGDTIIVKDGIYTGDVGSVL